jgi:hypothetical protein
MIEPHDDDLPIHDLLKPAAVPARKNGIAEEEIAQYDNKPNDG